MPKLHIEEIPVRDLIPYRGNARTHSPEQIAQIAASITAFGWTNPVLIDETRTVIAGHGRLEAAKLIGLDHVPAITISGLDDAQRRALVIADNKLSLNAGWDLEQLATELADLETAEFDLGLTGFSTLELDTLLGVPVEAETPAEMVAETWDGMPEYTHEDQTSKHKIIVHFETEDDLKAFAKLVGQKLTVKTKSIWYPEVGRVSTMDKRYAAAE